MDNDCFDALAEVMETVFRFPVNTDVSVWVNAQDEPIPLHPALVEAVQRLRRRYEDERLRRDDGEEAEGEG